jgi:hypothetical protein
MPEPVVTRISGAGNPFLGFGPALPTADYEAAEYTVTGTANAYARGPVGVDVVESAPFTTRFLVYRPVDAARFNGTVWVEWLNVSAGLDTAPDWAFVHTELERSGAAWVGVSAQQIGVQGGVGMGGLESPGLTGTDPDRYGSLRHPGDRFSYDIYSQVGAVVRGATGTVLEGLPIERVLAIGESQSAFRLTTLINDIDPVNPVFDGFLVHARGGTGAPLDDPDGPVVLLDGDPTPFRADGRAPVLCVESETDLMALGYLAARQDDDASFVLWEIAGTSHVDCYALTTSALDSPNTSIDELAALWIPSAEVMGTMLDAPVNAGPQHYVMNAALAALDRWVRDGSRPAAASRLEVADGAFVTDDLGIARGGIRTPHVDVPTALLTGMGNGGAPAAFLSGATRPFDAATLAACYPSRADYLARFDAATDAAVAAGFVLTADADEIKAIAAANSPI